MKQIAFVLLWAACGFFNWGSTLGYFTHLYPWRDQTSVAAWMAASGPFGSIVCLVEYHPFYWRLIPESEEEKKAAWHKEFPRLEFEDE